MADYKELIRKAIQALPENNGAARRAVYEKARAALVGQLRGLNPPLAARDITQHRLQLEDCIRQVEQEASEAVIAGLKQNEDLSPPALPPPRPISSPPRSARPTAASSPRAANGTASAGTRSTASPPPRQSTISASPRPPAAGSSRSGTAARPAAAASATALPRIAASQQPQPRPAILAPSGRPAANGTRPVARGQGAPFPRAVEPELEEEPDTIEDIIAAAESDLDDPIEVEDYAPEQNDEPEPPMFRLEQRPTKRNGSANGRAAVEPRAEARAPESRPLPAIVARAEAAKAAGRNSAVNGERRNGEATRRPNGEDAQRSLPRPQITSRQQPQPSFDPIRLPRPGAAMSSVREVDLEGPAEGDPQVAIERAIATLEREARNDGEDGDFDDRDIPQERPAGRGRKSGRGSSRDNAQADSGFARAPVENERGGSAVTIFLLVFVVLLVLAGGGGFWAWHEGFIDFDAMFGRTPVVASATHTATAPTTPATKAPQTNTEAAPTAPAQSNQPLTTAPATPAASANTPAATASAEPSAQTGGTKSEERLTQTAGGGDASAAPAAPDVNDVAKPAAAGTAASAGGSQSLLLEASQDGTTGAVPFSGTVEWSKGTDELGQPTLVGKASIPARNLGVSVLIRKNSDPTLPASHLMEINFTVNDSFIGGAISGLPGVLLKNEELVQGEQLVGASARVVGNSFLFALSSSTADEQKNKDLLTSRKWIDLAIIYATGKKAIITLEKDDKAQALFNDVFAAWAKEPAPAGK